MSISEDSTNSSSPMQVKVQRRIHKRRRKIPDRKKQISATGRKRSAGSSSNKKRLTGSSREDHYTRALEKKGKTTRMDKEVDTSEEEEEESFHTDRKVKRKYPYMLSKSEYETVTEDEIVRFKDVPPNKLLDTLKTFDPKFAGILSDFSLSSYYLNRLSEEDPGIPSLFDDAAHIEGAEPELCAAITTMQMGIHFMIKALGRLAKDPYAAKKQLISALSLNLHAFSRLHSNLVGKMVGVTDDMKHLVALKSHTGREMRELIDDAFFRTGGGSLALSAGSPSALAPASFPSSAAPPARAALSFSKPQPPPYPRLPSQVFPLSRGRAPFARPWADKSGKRASSFSPQRGRTLWGKRPTSPPRRH
jgi:hypothetical protein